MRRPHRERGAALFVVVLVVALLTAIGVFAMHATSLAQLGSGYSRRATTAFYLAELMANLRTATISDDTATYVARGLSQGDSCYSSKDLNPLLPVSSPAFCVAWSTSLATNAANASNTSLASDPEGFFGALSRPDAPIDQGVTAAIRAESTDHTLAPAGLAGFDSSGKTQIWIDTLTVSGALLPVAAVGDLCTAPITRASETERLRGYVVYVQP